MTGIDDPEAGTFEPRDERETLLAAFAETVAEHGYEAATIPSILDRAGLDQARFDRHFADLPDCIDQALAVFTDRCFNVLSQGFLRTPGTRADAIYGAFQALFRYCAGSPAFLYTLAVELPHGGAAAVARRARIQEALAELMHPALAELDSAGEPPIDEHIAAQMICGGLWEVFRTYAQENRIAELIDALPSIAFVLLSPLIGPREALRVADHGRVHASTN